MFDISITLILNAVISLSIIFLLILLVETTANYKKKQKMYGIDSAYMDSKDFIKNNKFFENYYKLINNVMTEKGKENYSTLVFYAILICSVALFGYFVSMKQLFFAIFAPISVIYTMKKIFTLMLSDVNDKIEEQLPLVIDNIIKVFSKHSDVKSVFYEVSKTSEEPLKSKFEKLSRKMISENPETALMEFAEEIDNIWVYSMIFIILSYKEEARKEDVIANLRHLSSIIEKENTLKDAGVTDKKYGVALNYFIAVVGALGGIANIMFNPVGKEFFFGSAMGVLCITLGYSTIVATIIINIKMTSRKGKKV